MCTSPLVRIRPKYNKLPRDLKLQGLSSGFDMKSKGYSFISLKKLHKLYGSYSEMFDELNRYYDYTYIPCRKCDECRMTYARDWSIRCYHEYQMRKRGCFITLTVDSSKAHFFTDNLSNYCKKCANGSRFFQYPIDYSLNKGLILDWLKTFRDYIYKKYKIKIRYFGCGEYGSPENSERPHYHIIIYGYDFPDRVYFKKSDKGFDTYISEELSKYWKYGFHTIQDVNMQICSYTAKYVMKKVKHPENDWQSDYERYYGRIPEFLFMSKGNCQSNRCKFIDDIVTNCKGLNSLRNLENPYCKFCSNTRGGLGYDWLCKYYDDLIKLGYVVVDGIKYPIPKYYLDIIKLTNKNEYDKLRLKTYQFLDEIDEEHPEYKSWEHLQVKKAILKNKLKHTRRE